MFDTPEKSKRLADLGFKEAIEKWNFPDDLLDSVRYVPQCDVNTNTDPDFRAESLPSIEIDDGPARDNPSEANVKYGNLLPVIEDQAGWFCTKCESLCSVYEQGLSCLCGQRWEEEVYREEKYPEKWIKVIVHITIVDSHIIPQDT